METKSTQGQPPPTFFSQIKTASRRCSSRAPSRDARTSSKEKDFSTIKHTTQWTSRTKPITREVLAHQSWWQVTHTKTQEEVQTWKERARVLLLKELPTTEYPSMERREKWTSRITTLRVRRITSLKIPILTCKTSSFNSHIWPLQVRCNSLPRETSKSPSTWRTTWSCAVYKSRETTENSLWTHKARFSTWTANSSEQQTQTNLKNCKMTMETCSKTCKI